MMSLSRRHFVQTVLLGVSGAALPSAALAFKTQKRPSILLRGSWHSICMAQEAELYKNWWAVKNVHFKGEPADALGKFLGEHVAKVMKKK